MYVYICMYVYTCMHMQASHPSVSLHDSNVVCMNESIYACSACTYPYMYVRNTYIGAYMNTPSYQKCIYSCSTDTSLSHMADFRRIHAYIHKTYIHTVNKTYIGAYMNTPSYDTCVYTCLSDSSSTPYVRLPQNTCIHT